MPQELYKNYVKILSSVEIQNKLFVDENIGIGTLNPTEKLDVVGNTKISGDLLVNSNIHVLSSLTVNNDVTVLGKLSALGTSYFANTVFSTTSAICAYNTGPGPALYVYQAAGPYDVASFYDGDGVEVLHVGNATSNGNGFVGINNGDPNVELSVKGSVSATGSACFDGNVKVGVEGERISNLTVTGIISSAGAAYIDGNLIQPEFVDLKSKVNSLSSNLNNVYTLVNNTSGNWNDVYTTVQAKSATEWDNTLANSYTHLNFLPLSGGTMTGKLSLPASTTASSPLNLGSGVIPTTTIAGDVFSSGNNIFFKGTTGGPYIFAYKNDTNTFLVPQIISTVSPTGDSAPALRITQAGAGNALVVEDSTNPDSSPFIVNTAGSVGIGLSSLQGIDAKLTVIGNVSATGSYYGDGSQLTGIVAGDTVATTLVRSNSGNWDNVYTTVYNTSGNWDNVYTSVNTASGDWNSVYSSVKANSASYFTLSGGKINGDVTIFGNLTSTGTQTFANTIFSTTSSLSVVHVGSGPSLYIGSIGAGDIASFYDLDQNLEMLHIGGHDGDYPNVGVKTSTPNVDFTVNGEISASEIIYDKGGNSTQWNSVYTTVQSKSATEWDNSLANSYTNSNFLPLSGGVITDKLTVAATVTSPRLNIGNALSIFAPASTVDGDVWITNQSKLAWKANGQLIVASSVGQTNTFTQPQVIQASNNTSATLRITQTGLANAILVEDDTNPDNTPFVVDNLGSVGIGLTSVSGIDAKLTVIGNVSATGSYYGDGSKLTGIVAGDTVATTLVRNNSANWDSVYTSVKDTSGNWDSVYASVNPVSSNWDSVYTSVQAKSATEWDNSLANSYARTNFLPLSGGVITGNTRFNNNVTIFGNLTSTGTQTFANTIFSTTSSLSVVHIGEGPALWIGNTGTGDIASFYDLDQNIEILHVGGNNGSFPNVGVKTSTPNVDFTVNGEISASNTIWDANGNSNQWNSVYSNVLSNSASYVILQPAEISDSLASIYVFGNFDGVGTQVASPSSALVNGRNYYFWSGSDSIYEIYWTGMAWLMRFTGPGGIPTSIYNGPGTTYPWETSWNNASITRVTGLSLPLNSVASAGTSISAARADHVHPYPTPQQIGALSLTGGTLTGTITAGGGFVITTNSANNDALRITQSGFFFGSGRALVVEDSTNPDSTPFIVDNNGSVGIGLSSVEGIDAKLTVVGNISAAGRLYGDGSNLTGIVAGDTEATTFIRSNSANYTSVYTTVLLSSSSWVEPARNFDIVDNSSYCGIAVAGSENSASVWKITKITFATDGSLISSAVASNVAWDDRLTTF
jgi:hypothetical protein